MDNYFEKAGLASVDKPWLKYYGEEARNFELPECSVYEYLWECNKDFPDDIAVNYYGNKISYGCLFTDIDRAAQAFSDYGIKEGDVVTLVTLSCYASVVCFYALNRIGAVADYVNVLATREDLNKYIRESESSAVICLDLFAAKTLSAAKAHPVKGVIYISLEFGMPVSTKIGYRYQTRKFNRDFTRDEMMTSFAEIFENAGVFEKTDYVKDPEAVCCYAHTGGTTGFPKTVLLNDKALNALACEYNNCFIHDREEVFLSVMIPYVIYGLAINIHMPLCLGLTTVIIPKFEPEKWNVYLKKYKPNHCVAIPAYIAPMIDDSKLAKADLSCFITIAIGGDGMTNTLEEKVNRFLKAHNCNASLLMGYGMSEVCSSAVTGYNYAHKLGSVGIPLPKNNIMAFNNDTETECGYNEVGEICFTTVTNMLGYKDNEEETKKLFVTHKDGSGWIHTGDMGYIDEDGFVFLTGRMKRMVMTVIDGAVYKIFPAQVEELISSEPSVRDVCVVGAVNGLNRVLRAYIIRNMHCSESDEEIEKKLRKLCANSLAEHMRPFYYEFCDKFPLTSAGKVDYQVMTEG